MAGYIAFWPEYVPRAAVQMPGPVWAFGGFAAFVALCQLQLLHAIRWGRKSRTAERAFAVIGALLLAGATGFLLVGCAFPGTFFRFG